jgi:hypothetical protein
MDVGLLERRRPPHGDGGGPHRLAASTTTIAIAAPPHAAWDGRMVSPTPPQYVPPLPHHMRSVIPMWAQKRPWTPPPFVDLTTDEEEDGEVGN